MTAHAESAPWCSERALTPISSACRQLLRVSTADWASTMAVLQCFERTDAQATWRPVGPAIPGCLGRSGMAWGRGLHGDAPLGEAAKREGDGCAPAGVFAITALFGSGQSMPGYRLPYWQATVDLKAIDDSRSVHYNQIVDQSTLVDRDWSSCEDMLREDARYTLGAVVAHNAVPVVPEAGSCIFLHVWQPGEPTAGCTAMALVDMERLAAWLDPLAQPVLVQLPAAEYVRRQLAWGLPPG